MSRTSSNDYNRIAERFAELCDLPPTARDARLAQLRADDPALAAQLTRLLDADASPARVIDVGPGGGAAALLAADIVQEDAPERLGRFRILRRLGEGAMGVVYEAEEDHPRRRVAIKVLHAWLRDPPYEDLFRLEAQTLGNLSHSGIPQVYAADEDGGVTFLVMELVRGTPLVDAARNLGLDCRLRLLAAVCDAVQHAHDAGIVHRDLKPENILVTADGQPKVLDFGIAMPVPSVPATSPTPAVGTLAYASPEQIERRGADVRADVYAIGAVAYELLTGGVPHDVAGVGAAEAARRKRIPHVPTCTRVPTLSPDIGWLVDQALSPDPAQRLRSAGVLGADLRRAMAHLPIGRGGLPWRARLWARRHRRSIRVAATAAALFVMGGGMGELWLRWRAAEREAAAELDLEAMREPMALLTARGAWAEAEAHFGTFTSRPEHRNTAALSRAWLEHAAWRRSGGREGVLAALAEAWIARTDAESARLAGLALSAELHSAGRYGAAGRVIQAIPGADDPALMQFRLDDALARRNFAAAAEFAEVDPAAARVANSLASATELGFSAIEARLYSVEGRDLLFTLESDHATWIRSPDGTVVGRLRDPEGARMSIRNLVVADGTIWLSAMLRDVATPATRLFRARVGDTGWTEVATLPHGWPSELRIADLGGGPRAWAALAYPLRGLRSVSLRDGSMTVPHPETDGDDSDVTSVVVADLDRDGTAELALGVADWRAYDVRVLRPDGPGRLALRARAPLGLTTGLAVVQRAAQNPVLAALKVDQIRNQRVFGAEHPYGPAAGVYLYALEGDQLTQTGMIPLPKVEQPGENSWCTHPLTGDVDGDGRAELFANVVRAKPTRTYDTLLAVDVAGPAAKIRTIAGLYVMDVADYDGDGDDELLVQPVGGRAWLLGMGQAQLPQFVDPSDVAAHELGRPPRGDGAAAAAWRRASVLLDLGLAREAAASLQSVAASSAAAEVRAEVASAAARLYERVEDDDGAAAAWSVAMEAQPKGSVAAVATREAAVSALARSLQFERAWTVARSLPDDPSRAWIAIAAASPKIDTLTAGALDPRWSIHAAEAVSTDGTVWTFDVLARDGVLLTTPVELQGDRVGISLDGVIDVAELGSGIVAELVNAAGDVVLRAGMYAHGGGGLTTVTGECLAPGNRKAFATELPAAPAILPIRIRAEWLNGTGRKGCRVDGIRAESVWGSADRLVPAGRHTLRLRSYGDERYAAASRFRARIRSLTVAGASWPAASTPTAAEEGRRALVHGDARGASEKLPDPTERVWASLRAGDVARATTDLRAAQTMGDETLFVKLLRRESSATSLVAEVLGPSFGSVAAIALTEPFMQYPWREDVHRAAAQPAFDQLPVRTPKDAGFQVARAGVLATTGDTARARAVAESVVASGISDADPDAARALAAAHRLLASIVDTIDPARAETHRLRAEMLERTPAR